MCEPVIYIDSQKACELDISIDLQKIYYHSSGYQRTSKKLYDVSYNAGGVIKDVATRFRKSCALTNKSSTSLAKMFKAIYEDSSNHLIWPKVLIVDKDTEYLGECRDLLLSHGIKIIQAKSKRSTSIAERDHQEFEKHAYIRQDVVDFLLPLSKRCQSWVKGLRLNDDIYNDTYIRLIRMSPNEAVKRALKGEKIIADPAVKHRRPIGFNEPRLTYIDSVLYLLEPGELEFGRRRITDMNWSPKVYHIKESRVQKINRYYTGL
ncbi:hypothetical protein Glove_557g10 [Diversispora epigaea]|uniref:Integrase catalytic domain-containing protein n=1 Tax=Diversispora epigaea TaxID=1348612 RepID=A0A397GER2_9GLOM|nr:hypothetical protein Glove_557g10 [Diversispora epigaea]